MNDKVIEEHLQYLVEEATRKGMLRPLQMGIEPTLGTYITHSSGSGPVRLEQPDPEPTFESDEKCGCRAPATKNWRFNYTPHPSVNLPYFTRAHPPEPWVDGLTGRMTPVETMQVMQTEIRQYNYELDRLDTISDSISVPVASTRAEARHEKKRATKRNLGAKR